MTSIVIAAHNEATVIGRCLDALLRDAAAGEFDVTVVPNGCTDATAVVAAARGVRVVEIAEASKAAALNAGDAVAVGFPRIYLDADIVVDAAGVRSVARAVAAPGDAGRGPANRATALAAVPARRVDLTGRPWAVRAYYAINVELPAFRDGLFGRGMVALSEAGRARFDSFPMMVADDLFLDSLFTRDEKVCVRSVETTVAAPRRTRDLVSRLVRVRRGNAAMREAGPSGELGIAVRPASRLAFVGEVVVPQPRLAPAGAALRGAHGGRGAARPTDPTAARRGSATTRPGRSRAFPMPAPEQRYGGSMIINICFHGIGTPERELEPGEGRVLDQRGHVPRRSSTRSPTAADVRLSFDDGNASDVEIGLPALRERGLTATSSRSPAGSSRAAAWTRAPCGSSGRPGWPSAATAWTTARGGG